MQGGSQSRHFQVIQRSGFLAVTYGPVTVLNRDPSCEEASYEMVEFRKFWGVP
jgi:hypothetical protein